MTSLPPVLVIVGPTASGKTPLSLLLAERLSGEIVSADSRQIYKYLDIGTAKPQEADLQRVRHHFIDVLDPKEDYNAGVFGSRARTVIRDILHRGKHPLLVGGSGLYIKAVIDGLFEGPGRNTEIRAELEDRFQRLGADPLLEELRSLDSNAAKSISSSMPRRIIRALEVYYTTGKRISQFHSEQDRMPLFEAVQIGLQWERQQLYEMINRRVDMMMEAGFLKEVESLKERGYNRTLNSLNTVGYRELFDVLEGKKPLDEAVRLIKQNTRRFAKRQLTWFKHDSRIRWIPIRASSNLEIVAEDISKSVTTRWGHLNG